MTASELLAPYVPRLVVEWLRDTPEVTYQSLEGTLVFADISGFTDLTERLARRGKVGAEEMSDVLNLTFEALLTAAYDYGAGLVKWGGDAVLLLFDNERHTEMACRAAWEMQRTIRRVGRLRTSSGRVSLRMSIGVHSGAFDFLLVGHGYRELVATGPGVTTVVLMEKEAGPGEVVVSPATAAALTAAGVPPPGPPTASGLLLTLPPRVAPSPNRSPKPLDGLDLGCALAPSLRDHLMAGPVDGEHRHVAVGFVEFSGADWILERQGAKELTAAVEHVVDIAQQAAMVNGITLLATDVNGDGGKLILVSGVPRTAGDDEARVLAAVRSVVDSGGTLALRAGVNSGRVFAGDFGPFYRRTYSIAGDCVNLAARLMARARPREIIATRSALARSRTSFEFEEIPPFLVKGKTAPIHAVSVGAPTRVRRVVETGGTPFVGRDEQLAALLDAFTRAAEHKGQVVELVGEPGMGKSRLVEELAARSNGSLLWACGDIYGTATPYQPLQRLVREQLGLAEGAGELAVATALARMVKARAPELLPWLPLVAIVAGVTLPSTPELDAVDISFRKQRLESAISELLGAILTTPTILVFDDVELMDEASVDLLRRLALDVGDRPWLVLVTRRSASPSPLAGVEAVRRVELSGLTGAETRHLLEVVTDARPLSPHHLAAIGERAGGNPLFLRELAAGAGETIDFDALPDSLEGVIAARIDALSSTERRLLRCAAVVGVSVDVAVLDAVLAPQTASELDVDWDRLSEFVAREPSGCLRFSQDLIRKAAYEGLPYKRRIVLHGRAGDAIEELAGPGADDHAELLSLHFLAAERYAAAWRFSRLAGDRAVASYASANAAEFYERAIAAARHLPDVDSGQLSMLHEALADARFVLGELDQADTALRRARRCATGDPIRLAELHLKTARMWDGRGQFTMALRWVTRGRRVLAAVDGERTAPKLHAQLIAWQARVLQAHGRSAAAIRWAELARDSAEKIGDRRTLAQSLEVLDWAGAMIGQMNAEAYALRAVDIYGELGDLLSEARALNYAGMRAFYRGRWREATEYYDRARTAYERGGDRWGAAIASSNVAEVLADQGRLDDAAKIFRDSIRVWRSARAQSMVSYGLFQLGRILARSGMDAEALDLLAEARCALDAGQQGEAVEVDAYTAECHLLAGRAAEALVLSTRTLGAAEGIAGAAPMVPLLRRVRGLALAGTGHHAEAREALLASLEAARAREALHEVAFTLDAIVRLGMLPAGDEGAQLADERASLFEQLGVMSPPHVVSRREQPVA